MRGQFEIDVALPDARPRWDSLDAALLWLDMQRGIKTRSDIPGWGYGFDWNSLDWDSIDRFLFENWDRLKAAASARPYLNQR